MNKNDVGYPEFDITGIIYDANIAYCKLLSVDSTTDIIGRNIFEWTSTLTYLDNTNAISQINETGEIKNLICEYLTFNNQKITISLDAYSERQSEGIRIYALCRNITPQFKEHTESLNQNQLLHSIIDSTPDLIFGKDLDGKFIICNKAVENLLQTKADELLGKTDFDFFTPEYQASTSLADWRQLTWLVSWFNFNACFFR